MNDIIDAVIDSIEATKKHGRISTCYLGNKEFCAVLEYKHRYPLPFDPDCHVILCGVRIRHLSEIVDE